MFLRFSHVAFINASFLFMAELYSIENCMDVPCFAYSLIDGHQVVSTFWVLWIVLLWTLCMPVWICFELFWVSYLSYWSLHGSWNAQVEAAPLRNHGSSKLEAHPLCSCRAFLHITLILGAVPQIIHGPLLPDRGALLQEPQLSTCSSGVKWKTEFQVSYCDCLWEEQSCPAQPIGSSGAEPQVPALASPAHCSEGVWGSW
jgi:hypothetical protein